MRGTEEQYYKWLIDKVCYDVYDSYDGIYSWLLQRLYEIPYSYTNALDENRAHDGVSLRHRYCYENDIRDSNLGMFLYSDCSVLEMMIALAIRCEETIMSDPDYGDRTGLWFWSMISNIGLDSQTDDEFSQTFVDEKIDILLKAEYERDGWGGLFYVRNSPVDLRSMDIWYQMNYYLNSLYNFKL